jgi:hypothetical protein
MNFCAEDVIRFKRCEGFRDWKDEHHDRTLSLANPPGKVRQGNGEFRGTPSADREDRRIHLNAKFVTEQFPATLQNPGLAHVLGINIGLKGETDPICFFWELRELETHCKMPQIAARAVQFGKRYRRCSGSVGLPLLRDTIGIVAPKPTTMPATLLNHQLRIGTRRALNTGAKSEMVHSTPRHYAVLRTSRWRRAPTIQRTRA